MATNLSALKAAIKLLADAAVDTESVVASGGAGGLLAVFAYRNLIPDLAALLPQIGDIPAEAKALTAQDYVTLVGMLVADLQVTDAHAGTIIGAGLDLLQELAIVVLPKIQALAAAVKKP